MLGPGRARRSGAAPGGRGRGTSGGGTSGGGADERRLAGRPAAGADQYVRVNPRAGRAVTVTRQANGSSAGAAAPGGTPAGARAAGAGGCGGNVSVCSSSSPAAGALPQSLSILCNPMRKV